MTERQMYDTTVTGRIVAADGTVATCPVCQKETDLTVFGYLGEPAMLMCENRHQFPPSASFDAVRLLVEVSSRPRRMRLT
jgi:hypothetical protein